MIAPTLLPVSRHFTLPDEVPQAAQLFRVVRSGVFGARRFTAGEIAWVESGATDGDSVVLVALGFGRPRFGRVLGRRLLGATGEPCLASRWEVAGQVCGVLRPAGAEWAVERLVESDHSISTVGEESSRRSSSVVSEEPIEEPLSSQLSLFQSAA